MTRGERRGREGVFGLRQLLEYLAARALLRDGWPLAKIATFTSGASEAQLAALLPGPPQSAGLRRRTRAQNLVSQFRAKSSTSNSGIPVSPGNRAPQRATLWSRGPIAEDSSSRSLDAITSRLLGQTRDRLALETRMSSPAEFTGSTAARRTLTIQPAPWCQLTVDEPALSQLDEKGLQIFVERIRRALREARRNQGEQNCWRAFNSTQRCALNFTQGV
jgi:hypothetical protein